LPIATPVEVIAHRGSGRGRLQPHAPPENTLLAFAYAFSTEGNADAAEVDIRLTRDGHVVAIHDATLRRTTDGRGRVADYTWRELRRLDAGRWKGQAFAGTRIPLLEEIIAAVPPGKRLYIEPKGGPHTIPRLASVLAACGKPARQLPIIAFGMESIRLAKRSLPEHECYLVTALRGRIAFLDRLIHRVRAAGADGVDARYPVSRVFLRRLRESGLKSLVWTVNRPQGARRLAAYGVKGITTDRPSVIRAALTADKWGYAAE
jgi:glycerophosphoryl diester phosphodiesterase